MNENQKVFPQGIRTFKKNDNAPDWILGSMVVSLNDFFDWCKGEGAKYQSDYKGTKQIRFDVTMTKDNRPNLVVNTYGMNVDETGLPETDIKPEAKEPSSKKKNEPYKKPEDDDSGLPF